LAYFHFSAQQLDVGFTLKPTGKSHLGNEVEAILNQYKPNDALSRAKAVFLRCDQEFGRTGTTFDSGYILRVEPLGDVTRHDEVWLGLLKNRYHHNRRFRGAATQSPLTDEQICSNYWLGVASSNPYWEILTSQARVVEQITPRPVSRNAFPSSNPPTN
jgi:hypothetical protein